MVDKVRRWFTPGRLVAVAFIANMAVVGIVYWAQGRDDSNRDAQIAENTALLAEIEATRAEARLTTCEQDNKNRLVDFTQTMAQATPDALARLEAQRPEEIPRAVDFLRAVLPQRVCTQDAIAAFYESGGAEGVVPLEFPAHVVAFLDRHG